MRKEAEMAREKVQNTDRLRDRERERRINCHYDIAKLAAQVRTQCYIHSLLPYLRVHSLTLTHSRAATCTYLHVPTLDNTYWQSLPLAILVFTSNLHTHSYACLVVDTFYCWSNRLRTRLLLHVHVSMTVTFACVCVCMYMHMYMHTHIYMCMCVGV